MSKPRESAAALPNENADIGSFVQSPRTQESASVALEWRPNAASIGASLPLSLRHEAATIGFNVPAPSAS